MIWSFRPWKFRWVNGPALIALGDLHVIQILSSLRDRRLWENLYARKRSLGVGGHWISLYSCYIETNVLFQRAGVCSALVSRTERVTFPAGLCILHAAKQIWCLSKYRYFESHVWPELASASIKIVLAFR